MKAGPVPVHAYAPLAWHQPQRVWPLLLQQGSAGSTRRRLPAPEAAPKLVSPYTSSVDTQTKRRTRPYMRHASSSTCVP